MAGLQEAARTAVTTARAEASAVLAQRSGGSVDLRAALGEAEETLHQQATRLTGLAARAERNEQMIAALEAGASWPGPAPPSESYTGATVCTLNST